MRFLLNTITFYASCLSHNILVLSHILKICFKLLKRALLHDLSKYSWTEAKHFIPHFHKLKRSKYGTKEYDDLLKDVNKALKHHYRYNNHHPEYFVDSIRGMDLYDIIEMWVDWNASVKRHKNGNIFKSLDHNVERFRLDLMGDIFVNTALWENISYCPECNSLLAPTKTGFRCLLCHKNQTHLCIRVRNDGILGTRKEMDQAMKDANAWLEEGLKYMCAQKYDNTSNCIKKAIDELRIK